MLNARPHLGRADVRVAHLADAVWDGHPLQGARRLAPCTLRHVPCTLRAVPCPLWLAACTIRLVPCPSQLPPLTCDQTLWDILDFCPVLLSAAPRVARQQGVASPSSFRRKVMPHKTIENGYSVTF
jgi:hypothetical protein